MSNAQWTKRTDVDQLVEGVNVFRNPRNKFVVMEVHYTADPRKRSLAWKQREQIGVSPSDWAREYELSWVVRAGRLVYVTKDGPLFDRNRHVFGPNSVRGDVEIPQDGRLIVGIDTGPTATRQGASFNILQPSLRTWTVDEAFADRSGVGEFMDLITSKLEFWLPYSQQEPLFVVDPTAIETDSKIELMYCVDVMRAYGLTNIIAGERSWTKRRKEVEDLLSSHPGPLPMYNVHERCHMHVDGFEGGYHHKALSPAMGGGFSALPVKNEYSEIHDGLQYAISRKEVAFQKVVVSQPTARIRSYGVQGRFRNVNGLRSA